MPSLTTLWAKNWPGRSLGWAAQCEGGGKKPPAKRMAPQEMKDLEDTGMMLPNKTEFLVEGRWGSRGCTSRSRGEHR